MVQKLPPEPAPVRTAVNTPGARHLQRGPGSSILPSLRRPERCLISTHPTSVSPLDLGLLPPPLYRLVHPGFLPWLFLSHHLRLLALMRMCAQSCLTQWDPMDCGPPGSLSMGFPRQECWSGLPFPPPGDLPDSGIEPHLLHWQAGSLPGKPLLAFTLRSGLKVIEAYWEPIS